MSDWDNKLYNDLEFHKVKEQAAKFCSTESARLYLLSLKMDRNFGRLLHELHCVAEYVDGLENIALPSLQSDEVLDIIKLLGISGSILIEEQFARIAHLSSQVNYLVKFLIKNDELFEQIRKRTQHVYYTDELITKIYQIIDRKAVVKSNASPALSSIRRRVGDVRKQIDVNFQRELAKYRSAGFLDDTKESFINGKRVLSVQAEFKRKVKGAILGSSGSGKLAFIEPDANVALNYELTVLEQEEYDEIQRILKQLTNDMREELPLIEHYQNLLIDLDQLQAKAQFARKINATLPVISKEKRLDLVDAYHPLLWLQNKKDEIETLPQSMYLNPEERVLVISGPNAGGKSITLKTVGLLQVMLQSGLLIPVKEQSHFCFFQKILTDIGDNQSIENHLSTYSFRLKNMKMFLEEANGNTLFLIDEFGSGSDPELGGALAEVFFESLYKKRAYGVITTHYSNIKVLADKMPQAFNACMLFNKETLEPRFELSIGQPGSSFTFEVAEKNEIPKSIIEQAKKRAQSGKLRLDESIASLQKEKAMVDQYREELAEAQQKAEESEEDFNIRREELEFKILRLQQTQQDHNIFINYGKRMLSLVDRYNGKNHRQVAAEFVKFLKIEFTKKQEQQQLEKKKVAKKMGKKIAPIDTEKKKAYKEKKQAAPTKTNLEVGDRVRIQGGTEIGTIVEFDRKDVVITFGSLKTRTKQANLTFVE